MEQLVATLQPYFTTKAPYQLPEEWRQNIVKVAPWITLAAAILGGLAFLGLLPILLGFSAFLGIYSPWYTIMAWLSLAALGAVVVLMLLSFSGLKSHSIKGWNFAFYGSLFSVVWSVFNWLQYPTNIGSLIGAALGAYISFYILFQVRDYYTGSKKLVAKPAPAASSTESKTA